MASIPEVLLVPVDGSEGAASAASLAATMAEKLDIPVRLLFAFPRDAMDMFGIPSDAPTSAELKYFQPEAFDQLRKENAAKVFSTARKSMGDIKVNIEEEVVPGQPAEAVLTYAEKVTNPMIIIGSRGLGGFKGLMLGSVSQRVVNQAHCPVTVVRPSGRK